MNLFKKLTRNMILLVAGICLPLDGYCQQNVFSVIQTTPVVQSAMVAGSTQNLVYIINVPAPPIVPPGTPIEINCLLTSSNPSAISVPTFSAANGCVNGVQITQKTGGKILVNLAVVAAANAAGQSSTLTMTFKQTKGRGTFQSPVVVTIPLTVASTSDRTITFKNSCPFPVWFGLSSGAVPSKTAANHVCQVDSDCTAVSAYSMCVSGICGGGWCQTGSDCLVTMDPNPSDQQAGDPAVCQGGSCSFCTQNSDCVGGGTTSTCNLANHQCFWNTPAPADASTNHYRLAPKFNGDAAATNTVILTDASVANGFSLLWSGGFAGRTHCGEGSYPTFPYTGGNTCKTAGCNIEGNGDGQGGCNVGEGFTTPSTQAEVTFASISPDTYDMTIINGTNVPVSMSPNNAATPTAYNNPFNCGNTGGNLPTVMNPASVTTTLGGCSWNFFPDNVAYHWVDADAGSPVSGTNECTADSQCATLYPNNLDYRCGLTSAAVDIYPNTGSAVTICGTPLGYWNQNEICGHNRTYNPDGGIVNCTLTGYNNGGNTLINLLACSGANAGTSCYTAGANSACGGCTNWSMLTAGSVPSNTSLVDPCNNPNADWVTNVLQPLEFLKQACPSSYVYPFDDKASTFTCPQNGGQSAVNYTVEFCPGGETGGIPSEEPA